MSWGLVLILSAFVWGEEVAEFPHLFFESPPVLGGPPSPNSCPGNGALGVELKALPCEPDPYQEICRNLQPKIRARAERLGKETEPVKEAYRKDREKYLRQVVEKLGPVPMREDPLLEDYFSKARLHYSINKVDGFERTRKADLALQVKLEPLRPKVESTIKKAKAVFVQMLKNSPSLGVHSEILAKLFQCEEKVRFQSAQIGQNGSTYVSLKPSSSMKAYQKALESGSSVAQFNPISHADTECSINLSPESWLDCAEEGPACFFILFHEFGHRINSCNFYHLQENAIFQKPDAKIYGNETAQKNMLDYLSTQSQRLGKILEETTQCLVPLSSPKSALLSSCYVASRDAVRQRCGQAAGDLNGEALGYPSQWSEAEADFWAGSALAEWMKDKGRFPDANSKVYAAYEVAGYLCADDREVQTWKDSFRPDLKLAWDQLNEGPYPIFYEHGPNTCDLTPAKGKPKEAPWWDPHQSWETRFNRHLLRNSDLREALGCKESQIIPMTCSPKGKVITNLPF